MRLANVAVLAALRKSGAALSVLILSLLLASAAVAADLNLVLKDDKGTPLLRAPVRNGSGFAITYTHSVALTPVTDYFVIKDGAIWLDQTIYHDFGAGLPHQPEAGQKMCQVNGKLIISGYDRKLPEFALRVGRVANHVLLLFPGRGQDKNDEIPLDSLAAPGSVINFSVEKNGP